MRHASLLSLLLCLLAASTASAHDTVPATWCPTGTQPVVLRQFSFSERQLIEYRRQRLSDASVLGSTCGTQKTCGIIDEWYWANQMAHEYALGLLRSATTALSESPMPIVKSPSTFNLNVDLKPVNGILDHHDQYRFSQGLAGDVVACRALATPLPSGTQVRTR